METTNQKNGITDIVNLVKKLKTEDSNYANLSKIIQIMYWILIPLFTLLTTIEYFDSKDTNQILSGVSFLLAFVIFALFFRKYHKEYKYVDYALPTIQMLKQAAWRYHPFQKRTVWVLLALLLMDVGITLDWKKDFDSIAGIQFIFLGVVLFSAIIGIIIWYVKYKPIRDEVLRLLREFETD